MFSTSNIERCFFKIFTTRNLGVIGLPCRPHWPPCFSLSHRSWASCSTSTTTCTTQAATSERDTAAAGLQFHFKRQKVPFPPLPFVLLRFCFCSSGLLNSAPISFRDCFGKFSCLFSVACFGILRLGMVCQQGCPTRFCLFRPEGFREAKKCAVNFR